MKDRIVYVLSLLSRFLNSLTLADGHETTSGKLGRVMQGDNLAAKILWFIPYVAVNLTFSVIEWRWWGHCERSIGRVKPGRRPW